MLLIAASAFIAGVLFGVNLGTRTPEAQADPSFDGTAVDLAPVWKAWALLDEKFVPATTTEPLSTDDKVWGMIEGLAAKYDDPYTTFLPPRESRQFEEDISGSFGGVGIEIGIRNGILTVVAPLKGTPGEAAGIMPGDRIVHIDGVPTKDMSIDEAVDHIRGTIGTEVVLTVAREGETEFLDIPIVRDNIEIPTLDTEERNGVFIISLYNFGGTAQEELRAALRSFVDSGDKKLVLDLRGNPGGYLVAAVDIASYFLPLGKTVVVEDHGDGEPLVHRSKGYNVVGSEIDIAVLIDGGSASASEILAGALQDHERATLIGSQTFGKGSVQELVHVTDDTSLKITVARWLTPDGTSLSYEGLAPDYAVEMTAEDMVEGRDPQLDAAVEFLRTGVLEVDTLTVGTSTPSR